MLSNLKIGYSAWGFLSDGIVDTPDGGRSHRHVLIDELICRGFKIYMLQKNRDLQEAGEDLSSNNLRFVDGLPEIDVLFLEYRWQINGRNWNISKSSPIYTPDFDRQEEILRHYSERGIPIFLWDKDQQFRPSIHPYLGEANLTIFEAALRPKDGRTRLLFPVNSKKIMEAKSAVRFYGKNPRHTEVIYIGNQYDRDSSLAKYYEALSAKYNIKAEIYGKWNNTDEFRDVSFHGRVGYVEVESLYRDALATILIAPERYYRTGQYTQRLFEALWQLCVPIVPHEYNYHEDIFPNELVVSDAYETAELIKRLKDDGAFSRQLLSALIDKVSALYSASSQVDTIIKAYEKLQS